MTFDKFLKRNQLIAKHLAQIANHRDSVGWVNSSTPLDASFRDVLAAQERLLTAAERLLESCAGSAAPVLFSADSLECAVEETGVVAASRLPLLHSMTPAEMSTAH